VPRARHLAVAFGLVALLFGVTPAARAIPPPDVPRSTPTTTPTPAPPNASSLPFGSPLYFVLDDPISSGKSLAGQIVHMHLQSPLIVNNVTLAPEGTPATLTIVSVHKAAASDNDGSVQIVIQPLMLQGIGTLPIRAHREYLTVEHTGGQLATRGTTDTITDVFIPIAGFYTALRKGHEIVLPVGSVLRALTGATVDAGNTAAIAIIPPPPMVMNFDVPHSDLTPAPFYTQQPPPPRATPKPRPTAVPTPQTPPPDEVFTPAPDISASPAPAPSPTGTK